MESREKEISRVTVWGASANIVLSAIKFAAGLIGHSSAMIADAVHSLSDLVSDIVVLVLVRISAKGHDKSHDYGHGKFETLATVIVAILLIVVGGKLMAEGVEKIAGVIHGETIESPGMIALWAALVSIVIKEILYQWTAYTGRKVNSPATVANAWHHRTDAFSSIGAAVGIGAAILLGGKWAVLDPAVCCGISLFILVISVRMAVPALKELLEESLPDETEADIHNLIISVEGVDDVHEMKTRKLGPDIIIDSHIVVDPTMSVFEAHRITEIAEERIRSKFGEGTQISLHIEPSVESE